MNRTTGSSTPTLRDGNANRMQRVLVIDDDEAIRRLVGDKLEHEGYQVWTAEDGQHALDIIDQRGLPHLAIVDIHMPGMDGFRFCEIVQAYADLPVIFLTAVDDESSIIRGIKYFAEDYVVKPFSPRELVARVERVLRRIGDFAYTLEPRIQIDAHLEVDLAHQEVSLDGEQVRLTPTENKILHILMGNAPRVVTSSYLLERIWPLTPVQEEVLRVHVHRLRHKLEPHASSKQYIVTERGAGYRFSDN